MSRLPELFLLCLRVGLFTFGGGLAIVPLIQQNLVGAGFMTARESVDMIAISQMTPGPFAINAATFAGTKLAGIPGALIATLGMVLPSVLIALLVAKFFFSAYKSQGVQSTLSGIRPVVLALIAGAGLTVARETFFLTGGSVDLPAILLAALVFALLRCTKAGPVWLLTACGLLGALFLR
ncbi:MAG: chromate transporter [Oscillospiraceae bacterium]|jgi:chromate transporter|nr:chromate transporter [Oscillospiraceae bacterium]